MGTPPGKRCKAITTASGNQIHVYSDNNGAVLQLRRTVPTAHDPSETSFKVGVVLNAEELLELAGELLTAAVPQVRYARVLYNIVPENPPAEAGVEGGAT